MYVSSAVMSCNTSRGVTTKRTDNIQLHIYKHLLQELRQLSLRVHPIPIHSELLLTIGIFFLFKRFVSSHKSYL